MLARVGVAGVLASLLVSCTPSTPPTSPTTSSWQQVELPAGVKATSLAVAGSDLLVGGRSTDTPAPRLLRLDAGTVSAELRLEPADPNAAEADLAHLTVDGDDVYAIGTMIAGAHSNPRLTTWDGSLGPARVRSHTQAFFTFGGHDAGPLLGTVVVGGRPVIFGSRVGATGPYGLLWTRTGHTWKQQEPQPALASVADRELSFLGLGRLGKHLVVAGDELGLAGGLNQQPVVFAGTVAGDWQELPLPVPDDLVRVPGQLSRATSVACPATGDTCWVSGWVRGHALAWPVTITADGAASAGVAAPLPGDAPPGNNPTTLVGLAGDRPVVFTNATSPTLQYRCADGWRSSAAPPGTATAVAAAPDALYAIAGDRLWRLAVPSC
jgi:hypothetical protein